MVQFSMRLPTIVALMTFLIAFANVHSADAQSNGEAGSSGRAGGSGGAGGYGSEGGYGGGGGFGGQGGGGGGGGGGIATTGGGIAAFGEYVYVTKNGLLYQFAAYDLKRLRTIEINAIRAKGRNRNLQADKQTASGNRRGRSGQNGNAGEAGAGEFGGAGGSGGVGGFAAWSAAFDAAEDVAAFGDFVYVLSGDKLHKLAIEDLSTLKTVSLTANSNADDAD